MRKTLHVVLCQLGISKPEFRDFNWEGEKETHLREEYQIVQDKVFSMRDREKRALSRSLLY